MITPMWREEKRMERIQEKCEEDPKLFLLTIKYEITEKKTMYEQSKWPRLRRCKGKLWNIKW